MAECPRCQRDIAIGDWPFCPHGKANPTSGFLAYFDIGLGREVTGWGDVRKAMREEHLDFRDHPSKAKTAEFMDRAKRLRSERGRSVR